MKNAWLFTLMLDLMTWILIRIFYSSRTTYNVLSFLGNVFWSYPWHMVLKTNTTPWPQLLTNDLFINRIILHLWLSSFQIRSFCGKRFLSFLLHKVKGHQPINLLNTFLRTFHPPHIPIEFAKQYAPPSLKDEITNFLYILHIDM